MIQNKQKSVSDHRVMGYDSVELGVEGLAGGSGVEWSGVVGRSGQVKKEERAQLTSTDIKLVSVWQ